MQTVAIVLSVKKDRFGRRRLSGADISGRLSQPASQRPDPRPGRSRARFFSVLPALALLLGALWLFAATPAQAQTTVWSATLTVKSLAADLAAGYVGCSNLASATANKCSTTATLSDDEFTYNGTSYTITAVNIGGGAVTVLQDGRRP